MVRRTVAREGGPSRHQGAQLKVPSQWTIFYEGGGGVQLVPHYAERRQFLYGIGRLFDVFYGKKSRLAGRLQRVILHANIFVLGSFFCL